MTFYFVVFLTIVLLFVSNQFLCHVIGINYFLGNNTFEEINATSLWIGGALTVIQLLFCILFALINQYVKQQWNRVP